MAGVHIRLDQLGRQRDPLIGSVTAVRDRQAETLAASTGRGAFAQGQGVPRAATYVFVGDIDVINRELQQLHCRRSSACNDLMQAALVSS